MKEIGGFFELELDRREEYHKDAIALNSGRNSLIHAIKSYMIKKVYIPKYICDSLVTALYRDNIKYEFYDIGSNMLPKNDIKLKCDECLLYVNYFGVCDNNVLKLIDKYKNKIIIDNTQAFYTLPQKESITFYSPRKFFGVSDGGYLYNQFNRISINFLKPQDSSIGRMYHLTERIENISTAYLRYRINENSIVLFDIEYMSKLTKRILQSIDYKNVQDIRRANFMHLHFNIGKHNKFVMNNLNFECPMIYPLLVRKEGIKEYLISKKIYVATYWDEVLNRTEKGTVEYDLAKYLIPLPIDQRYNFDDMDIIIKTIKERLYEI